MEEESYTTEQKESIKLSKGMTGKYGWEIKLLNKELTPKDLDRLSELNKILEDKYNS